jgi:hypothetical protein
VSRDTGPRPAPENGHQPAKSLPARVGAGRPHLVVVEGISLSTPADPYLTLKALADYSSCSVRWLRDRLGDPMAPLPHYRLPGGKILVRRSEADAWLARYRQIGHPDLEAVVADVLASLR